MSSALMLRSKARRRLPRGARYLKVTAPAPWRRAILAAFTATVLGVGGHALAGGRVDVVAVALAFVPVLALARAQGAKELGWWAFAGMLLLAQLVVHVGASSCAPRGMNISTGMLTAHVCAAALAGVALRWHEARAWARARGCAIRAWVRALLGHLPAAVPCRAAVGSGLRELFLLIADDARSARIPARRGPPAPTLA